MELDQLKGLLTDFGGLYNKVTSLRTDNKYEDFKKQYESSLHPITDETKRPDKLVEVPDPEAPDGYDQTVSSVVKVTRISIPLQKLIVSRAAAFLCGNPIQLNANAVAELDKNMLEAIQKTWDENKLDFDSKKIAKILMSETEVAELWYTEAVDDNYWMGTSNAGAKFALRMKILSNSSKDKLHPVYNNAGDMIAFGREYTINTSDHDGECHFDIYTAEKFYFGVRKTDSWEFETKENVIGKIPVIYYKQDQPEWADVQNIIDRYELVTSNHGDTNDYNGSPTHIVEGKILGYSKKGETGKVLEVAQGAKVTLLSWDAAPESIKLEMINLRSLAFDMTDTPDISFEQMSKLGTYSGIALKMLFLGAHMKAADKEEIFGKGIQRRINYIKAAMAKINVKLAPAVSLSIKPKFEYYLPKHDSEKIDMLTTAVQGGVMSKASALKQNPLIEDGEAELKLIKAEAQEIALTM